MAQWVKVLAVHIPNNPSGISRTREPTYGWKERADSSRLSSDLHTHARMAWHGPRHTAMTVNVCKRFRVDSLIWGL